MEVTPLSHFICLALSTVAAIPFVVILVQEWRFPKKALWWALGGSLILYAACMAGVYLWVGSGRISNMLVSVLPMILSYGIYAHTTRYDGGRLLFIVVVGSLLATVCDAVSCLVFPYGCPWYIVMKLACVTALSTLLWFFRGSIQWLLETGGKGWMRIAFIPFTLWVALLGVYVLPMSMGLTEEASPMAALCICGAVPLFYMTFSYFIRSLRAEFQSVRDTDILRSQVRALERQVERIQTEQEQGRIFRHDLRYYLHLLDANLNTGDLDGARHVADSIEATLEEYSGSAATPHAYTGNPLLDTVFSAWAERCAAAEVEFSVQLTLPPDLRVGMIELAVVVSNALDNACNACRVMPEGEKRIIRVYDSPGAGQFFLAIDNTYSGSVAFDAETGLPVSNRPGHGYGTKSVAAFAKRYGAAFSCSAEDGWFRLRLLI